MDLKEYIDIINPKTVSEAAVRIAKVDDQKKTFLHVVIAQAISIAALAVSAIMVNLTMNTGNAASPYNEYITSIRQLQQNILTPLGMTITFISGIIVFYIGVAIFHQICKALGSNGKQGNLLYAFSVANVSYITIYATTSILNAIPVLNCLSMMFGLLIGLYVWYLYYKIIGAVYTSLDRTKAIIALILYMVTVFVLSMIVYAAQFAIGM
jgi:hypothetical protein